MDFTKKANHRRSKFRFAMERDVRYKVAEDGVVVAAGSGQTIDVCSGGVAIVSEQPLTPGGFVELSISWPVMLDETCPMRFIVFGRVLRCDGRRTVCSIDKYEFRTSARTFQASVTPRGDGMLHRWVEGVRKEGLKVSAASF